MSEQTPIISPAASISPEREVYQDYERNRRLQLARVLLPIFAAIQFSVFLVSVIFFPRMPYGPPIRQIFLFNTILVGVDAALHVVGLWYVRRGRVTGATLSVIVPVGITVAVPLLVYDIFDRGVPAATSPIPALTLSETVATLVLIVLAGLLATNRWILVATTLLMNGFTVFILNTALGLPGVGPALQSAAVLLLAFPVLVQWAVTGILIAASGTYLQTLRELGDVRIAFARAQQLDALKDQFIAHVNHELRSPVMALQGHVELLLLTEGALSPEERHTYLERAKRAGDDLVSLVTSILSVRRLEQDTDVLVPERVDVRDAVEAAIRFIDPREGNQTERELRLHIPAGLEVWAEPVRVRQILTNLLSNAVKYSPPGSPVDVSAEIVPLSPTPAARRQWTRRGTVQMDVERQMVRITIRDYGLGIPTDQIPLLFTRFVRLPRDLASSVPGNGLGLYLCRVLAEAMGGAIQVESVGIEGEGSAFQLRLPAPTSTAPTSIPTPAASLVADRTTSITTSPPG